MPQVNEYAYPEKWGKQYKELHIRRVKIIIDHLNSAKVSMAELFKLAGMSSSTGSQILSGKYPTSPQKQIDTLHDVVLSSRRRHADTSAFDIPFVETSVWTTVSRVCDGARALGSTDSLGAVYGFVGVGKTTALKEYCNRNSGAYYFRAFRGMTVGVLLDRLVDRLGATVKRNNVYSAGSNAAKLNGVIESLAGKDRLIVMDESTRMHSACLDLLRDIADDAEVGLVLAGREQLEAMLQSEEGRYGEISSRVFVWPPVIRGITENDTRLIVDAFYNTRHTGIGDDCHDMFWQCCAGSARGLRNLLRSVHTYCHRKKVDPTPAVISDSWTRAMRTHRRRNAA
ncbi:MAG: AAA family ATPase [Arenicellales bacterium]